MRWAERVELMARSTNELGKQMATLETKLEPPSYNASYWNRVLVWGIQELAQDGIERGSKLSLVQRTTRLKTYTNSVEQLTVPQLVKKSPACC